MNRLEMAGRIAAALYPSSVDVRDLPLGQLVRNNIDDNTRNSNDEVGVITHIVPVTQKVWVSWPRHKSIQHSPEDLIFVPDGWGKYMGKINQGYNTYEKNLSEDLFGWVDEDGKVQPPRLKEGSREHLAAKLAFQVNKPQK